MIVRNGLLAVLVITVIASFAPVADGKPPQKVVGGTPAYPGEIPYQVSLRYQKKHFCSGAIIGPRHVLSTASCVRAVHNMSRVTVLTGSVKVNEGQSHKIKEAMYHTLSDQLTSIYDIALIALVKEITFNFYQKKINLPPAPASPPAVAVVSGWGAETNPYGYVSDLTRAEVFLISSNDCQKALNNSRMLWVNQICTLSSAGVGTCTGDEGGPLVYNKCLIGIVSRGPQCGQGHPDVYTSIYNYLDWINHFMRTT